MSEFDDLAGIADSQNVDNGFEKLDALSTPEAEAADDFVSSSTAGNLMDEGGISAAAAEGAIDNLVDLSIPAAVTASNINSSSSAQDPDPIAADTTEEPSPEPTPRPSEPAPVSQITLPTKKSTPTSG